MILARTSTLYHSNLTVGGIVIFFCGLNGLTMVCLHNICGQYDFWTVWYLDSMICGQLFIDLLAHTKIV